MSAINHTRKGKFELVSDYKPAGDQPQAIKELTAGLDKGANELCLLGVTGSGKTFAIANTIAKLNRPAMILSHNKTLAAQLYAEFRNFFPNNAVEYFVSYYDYYQPEAYVPARDLFIDKDSSINEQIEQLRLSATKSLIERNDVIVVATVSAIFGIGDPVDFHSMVLHINRGEKIGRSKIVKRLTDMQYKREKFDFSRGTFRVRGDVIDVFPSESSEKALRIELFDDEVEQLTLFDPLTGALSEKLPRFTVFPSSHYATPAGTIAKAIKEIKLELSDRYHELDNLGKNLEAHRIQQRTLYDIEMMTELGFCTGIENYSRHMSSRNPGEPPPTLFDYLPSNGLLFLDESHVTVPQIGAMYKGDRSRKTTLVEYGFRLPSALDNRPLTFEEFDDLRPQTVYVSATPSEFEKTRSEKIIEMVVRPTGLIDPAVIVRPATTQIDDLLSEIKSHVARKERVLVTTLTKKMAEQLSEYLTDNNIKGRYLHSDIDTIERAEILRDLRAGVFDVLVGINLLREGLDLPEVALVAILDADKEGFLRSERSLIQTIGRAARNINGKAILYADKETGSMQRALAETDRRREAQEKFNKKHGITPKGIQKAVKTMIESRMEVDDGPKKTNYEKHPQRMSAGEQASERAKLEKQMLEAAKALEFEQAANWRDQLRIFDQAALGLEPNVPAPKFRGDQASRKGRKKTRSGQV